MYLYHVLFIFINIYGVDCQKKNNKYGGYRLSILYHCQQERNIYVYSPVRTCTTDYTCALSGPRHDNILILLRNNIFGYFKNDIQHRMFYVIYTHLKVFSYSDWIFGTTLRVRNVLLLHRIIRRKRSRPS
jgi:hypothetical protein